jgi:hypothetical protein
MSNVVGFFAKVGSDSNYRRAGKSELKAALEGSSIDATLRSAILNRDLVRMRALLDADNKIYCSVFPVKVPTKQPEKKPVKTPPKKPGKAPAKPAKPTRKK